MRRRGRISIRGLGERGELLSSWTISRQRWALPERHRFTPRWLGLPFSVALSDGPREGMLRVLLSHMEDLLNQPEMSGHVLKTSHSLAIPGEISRQFTDCSFVVISVNAGIPLLRSTRHLGIFQVTSFLFAFRERLSITSSKWTPRRLFDICISSSGHRGKGASTHSTVPLFFT